MIVASSIVGVLLVAATGLTIWRYSSALGAADRALEARQSSTRADVATTAFWRQRESMNEYLVNPSPDALGEIGIQQAAFAGALDGLGSDSSSERPLVARALAADGAFVKSFNAARAAGAGGEAVLSRLNQREARVVAPLASLESIYTREVAARQGERSRADRQALIAALVGALVAIAAVLAFALFTLRLVARISGREEELQRTVESLSDRDTLLARLRSTTGVLGAVASELRAAAREAAAAPSEQSSAVAETSATIEELAATARSIADNARAVADAAEQTGDTMRDMQEKVEAIAAALALARRAQPEDRRDPRADQRDRRADQPARAERRDRGRPRRRRRPGLRGRRQRGPQARRALASARPTRSARSSPRSRTRPTRRSWPPSRAHARRARSAS